MSSSAKQDLSELRKKELLQSGWNKLLVILDEMQQFRTENKYKSTLIWSFLLETQLIELELQELLTSIDISPSVFEFKARVKKNDKEYYELTLGELTSEVCKYNEKLILKLGENLPLLNKKRILLSHHLFNKMIGLDELIEESKKGLLLCDLIVGEIYKINIVLDAQFYGRFKKTIR